MQANIDYFGRNGFEGPLASYIAEHGRINPAFMRPVLGNDGQTYFTVYKGGDPKKKESYQVYSRDQVQRLGIQVYATLRRDEWKQLDQAVLQASHIRLGGVQDLIDNNLTYNLTNAMGTTVLEHHTINESMEAQVDMNPAVRSRKDRPNYTTVYTPIPVIHSDFSIGPRALEASRRLGNPLDVDAAAEATRVVLEKREQMLFNTNQTPFTFGGGSIYSYLDHPNRNLKTLTGAWSGLTGAQILADVIAMKQMAINARHYGPFMLYVPTAYETKLDDNYVANYPGTIRERLLKVENIKGIKTIDTLPANNVVLVEMQTGTVRLINGMGIQTIQWQVGSSLSDIEYKVICIQVPQVRSDQAGKCGVVHGSV